MPIPSAEEQVRFLVQIQRLLADGSFVASYKFALLSAFAHLAIERGNDIGTPLRLTSADLALKFIKYYWRQVVPYAAVGNAAETTSLHQNTGKQAAVITAIATAHTRYQGSLHRLLADQRAATALVRKVARTVAVMPLWKLQTVGPERLDFLYPNIGRGHTIELRGEAVFCLRHFHSLLTDLIQGAWVRFVRRLPRNRPILGEAQDLREFLFGSDRASLAKFEPILGDLQSYTCFYCRRGIREGGAVDHYIPWARYPLDLGHNFVLACATCNGRKADRLAALQHLEHWCQRNDTQGRVLSEAFDDAAVPHDLDTTWRIGRWAYGQAEAAGGKVWLRGAADDLVDLPPDWRTLPGMVA